MGFVKKVSQRVDFKASIKALKPNTRSGIENTVKLFSKYCETENSTLDEAIEELKVVDKKRVFEVLQDWVNWLDEQGRSYNSIPTYFSHLRTYLYYQGIPISDQERKREIKYPKAIQDEKHGLSIKEIQLILSYTRNPKKKAEYLTMLSSGLRIGEAVQLRKKDLELIDKNFLIHVRGKTTKTQKGRITFMSFEATNLVLPFWEQLNDDDLVYGTNKNPSLAKAAEHVRFNHYRKQAGLTKQYDYSNRYLVSMHSFRAFFITKVSRHDPNLAKRLAGQKGYLDQYDRLETKEKLELYIDIEPGLIIFDSSIKDKKIEELEIKNDRIENQEKKIDELEKKYNSIGLAYRKLYRKILCGQSDQIINETVEYNKKRKAKLAGNSP